MENKGLYMENFIDVLKAWTFVAGAWFFNFILKLFGDINLQGLTDWFVMLREFFGMLSFIIATGYTLYKWLHKNKSINKKEQ